MPKLPYTKFTRRLLCQQATQQERKAYEFMSRALTLAEMNINPLALCLLTLSYVILLFDIQIYKLALIVITNRSLFKQYVQEVEFTRKNKYPIAVKSLIGN